MNSEKGQATAVVLGVAALVILTIVGLGIYAFRNPTYGLYGKDNKNKPSGSFYDNQGTTTISTATSTKAKPTASSTISIAPSRTATSTAAAKPATTRRVVSASPYQAVSGPAYRAPTFGLTVPGSYTVSVGQNVYSGVPATASYNFFSGGVYAFTINIFSKEQWNDIRIQETRNAKEGTGPDYLGEGRYLGENMTWIFSIIYGSYQPSDVRFY